MRGKEIVYRSEPADRACLAAEANAERERRQAVRDAEVASLRHDLALLVHGESQAAQHQHARVGSVVSLDAVRYSMDDIEQVFALFQQYSGQHSFLNNYFSDCDYDDEPPSDAKDMLDKLGQQLDVEYKDQLPWWCKHIAVNRERFIGTGLGRGEGEDEWPTTLYVPMAAKVNPREVMWLVYHRREDFQWMFDDPPDDADALFESSEFHGQIELHSSNLHF